MTLVFFSSTSGLFSIFFLGKFGLRWKAKTVGIYSHGYSIYLFKATVFCELTYLLIFFIFNSITKQKQSFPNIDLSDHKTLYILKFLEKSLCEKKFNSIGSWLIIVSLLWCQNFYNQQTYFIIFFQQINYTLLALKQITKLQTAISMF